MLRAPDPTDQPCDAIAGPSGTYCEQGTNGGGSGGGGGVLEEKLDPLSTLANSVADAGAWTSRQLGKFVEGDNSLVDFTNASFVKQYAIVFAASTVLTLLLWLLAVAKRAIRGAPLTTALSEAIGLLWIAVAATAFSPLILYTVVGAAGAVTRALIGATDANPGGLFEELARELERGDIGGGPIMLIAVALLTIVLAGALMLLLVLRTFALYAGALLGVFVYSGLVDKDLWGHVRRWAGIMVVLILLEPGMAIILGFSSVLRQSDDQGAVLTSIAVMALAIGAAVMLIYKFPGWGDAVKVARTSVRAARTSGSAAAGTVGAVLGVRHGIQTHGSRDNGSKPSSSSSTPRPSNPASGGIGAHAQRPAKPQRKKGD